MGKGKKKGKDDIDDDELERELAELHAGDATVVGNEKAAAAQEDDATAKQKTAKQSVKKDEEKVEEVSGPVKTAAQKREEKKERERLERQKQNAKERARTEREAAAVAAAKIAHPAVSTPELVPAVTGADQPVDASAEKSDAVDPKSSAKGGAKKPAVKQTAMSKAIQAAAQERLRLLKEDEERVKREEEERTRREEEAEQARLKAIAEEEERKLKKKEKDRQRKERLKAEGKPVTAKQKAEQARAKAFIDAARAQGIDIPQIGEKVDKAAAAKVKRKPVEDKLHATEAETKSIESEVTQNGVEKPKTDEKVADDDAEVDHWEEHVSETSSDTSDVENSMQPSVDTSLHVDLVEIPIKAAAPAKKVLSNLRSPIVCVLGHVDTGKTKTLDYIRKSHVQDGEAGGITQQIGATEVPLDAIRLQTSMVGLQNAEKFSAKEIRIPGMLIIDTPGHEAFSNLRSRGSSLCDIAILVVDLMHGLEKQTIESINLLKSRKTPFVVAFNKVDRLYQWRSMPQTDIRESIAAQLESTRGEFRKHVDEIIAEFAVETELNVRLFNENPNPREFISAVPTSAHTGDGMGNLIALLVEFSQTFLSKRLAIDETRPLDCTVMEVKTIPGLGTTIDIILVNGKLREGETIVVAGQEGPIVTTIRALLMPAPLHELRVRNEYEHYKEVVGAQGLKLIAKDLEKAVAGLPLLVAKNPEEIELHKKELQKQLSGVLRSIKISNNGVYVQASTIGSLEALLEFLKTSKIQYCGVNIGPVHKSDIRKAAVMLEHDSKFACVLAFDVRIDRDAQQLADELGVQIFSADIIYHLFDKWTKYTDELRRKAKEENQNKVVFPSKLKILPEHVYGRRDPIIVGVRVESGRLRLRTPICIVDQDNNNEVVDLGVVTSIEINHKQIEMAKTGDEVCIRIDNASGSVPKLYGRHFDENDALLAHITRDSIDLLKEYFRDDMDKSDWQLIIELKKQLSIF